ncbi:hypothetical protein [Streptomyces sp. SID8352]|uniref:hypothetical protein n=1 Tax=Streptomyces sp. SID8352 TaxID=2690338 RepID=UPI00136C97AB|nr:hypothetical protein [Streptomyces sp. SID8352]MYU20648.1 hypothetical protein [Streptomyces sp. SID8352]
MGDGTKATAVTGRRRERETLRPGTGRRPTDRRPLAAVAALFTLAQLLLNATGLGLGWDEIVYVSQVTTHHPAAFFSAPRSRGVSLLVAPVASWSASTALLRTYLALLSGLGLYLALRAWRGLFPARVLATAGALFATLWVTLFYGPQAMPNLWVALGALLCVGFLLRALPDRPDRPPRSPGTPRPAGSRWPVPSGPVPLGGVMGGAALMAWMRPADAVWVSAPLLVLVLARRHLPLAAALVGGLSAGAAEWVAEAYARYGGLGERLAEASRIQGGLGRHLAFDDQLRALGGRGLCRPCAGALPSPALTWWWFALPLLAALALAVAIRAGRTLPTAVPLACAATAAAPYLLTIDYAAPRFLQPAYALLAPPVADALGHLARAPRGRWRPAATTLLALGAAAHLAAQLAVLTHVTAGQSAARRDWARAAGTLHALGVRPPCLLTGYESIPLGYYTGCSSGDISGHNANTTPAAIGAAARRIPVAAVTAPGAAPPPYARAWTPRRVGGLTVLLAPPPDGGAAASGR